MPRTSGASCIQRAREPVEFGHDERVAVAAGRKRLAQSWPVAIGAGQAMVDIDPFARHAESAKRISLHGQVLFVGGDAGVADQESVHEILLAVVPTGTTRQPICSVSARWAAPARRRCAREHPAVNLRRPAPPGVRNGFPLRDGLGAR